MYIDSLKFSEGNRTPDYRERRNLLKFTNFVNRVLFMLKSKSINKFSLKMNGHCRSVDWSLSAPTWLTIVIARDPKVLKLKFNFQDDVEDGFMSRCTVMQMPACVFTCKTLTVLRLHFVLKLNVPNYVCLPNVTTLELGHVRDLPDDSLERDISSENSLRRLISGCSSLESLCIERDVYDGVQTFTIYSPTLKFLKYRFICYLARVRRCSLHMKLELNAPALEHLQLDDNMSDYSIQNLCSLEYASFHIYFGQVNYDNDEEEAELYYHCKRIVKLILQVQNVKHLWLNGHTLEALSQVPTTPKESHSIRISKLTISATDPDCNTLQELLEGPDKSPNLYLSEDSSHFAHLVHWKNPKELPPCLLSYLETISVNGFRGLRGELNMIAYILKNAEVLRKMTISEATSESKAKFKLREEILKFERGSMMCEIKFS